MTDLQSVLVADDDAELCAALAEHLTAAGFIPVIAGTAAETEAALTAPDARFNALILDLGLPDGDGCVLCARLRQAGVKLPILMLTGAAGEQEVVRGLDAGANDYICKPFRTAELLARLHAQLRAFENSEDAAFVIGPYTFRPAARVLYRHSDRRRLPLTAKEAAILKFLYRAGQRQTNRKDLLREVWGYNTTASTHTLETHIYRLRQKIERDPTNPSLLLTGKGGYRLSDDALRGHAG
jgi:DNA-binding response OmpR family regulator